MSIKTIERIFHNTKEGVKLKQATDWLTGFCEMLYDKKIDLDSSDEYKQHLKRFEEQVQKPAEDKWQQLLIIYKVKEKQDVNN